MREQALTALLKSEERSTAIDLGLRQTNHAVWQLALQALAVDDPNTATGLIEKVMTGTDVRRQQLAIELLSSVKTTKAATLLNKLAASLADGSLVSSLQLDVYNAAKVALGGGFSSRGLSPRIRSDQVLPGPGRGCDVAEICTVT